MPDWSERKLSDLVAIKHGYAFKGEHFSEDPTKPVLVTPGNFSAGGGFRHGKVRTYAGPEVDGFNLSAGDLIVTMTDLSKSGDTLGYPALVPAGRRYLHNQRIGLVTFRNTEILPRFAYYVLMTREYRQHILATATGSTVRHSSPGRIGEYAFRLPPRGVQQAVSDILGALDDKAAVNDRIAATAAQLADAEFGHASQQATGARTLGDIIELAYGKALPASRRLPGAVAVYGSGGVSGWHNEPLVRGPGIIVGRKGTVGSVYWSRGDFFPIDTTYYATVRDSRISIEYVYFLLTHLKLNEMNSDSAVPGLNRAQALAVPTYIPDADIIAKFTERVRPLFAIQDQAARENQTLTQLRDVLLPELMSGRLLVKDVKKVLEEAV